MERILLLRGVSKPKTEDRRPKTEDRRLGNQLNEMCWNAFFDAKTMKSIRSSFWTFTPLKLWNEDPAKTLYLTLKRWNRWGLRFAVLPASICKIKTVGFAETSYLTLKHWNQWGLRFVVLPASNYKMKTKQLVSVKGLLHYTGPKVDIKKILIWLLFYCKISIKPHLAFKPPPPSLISPPFRSRFFCNKHPPFY